MEYLIAVKTTITKISDISNGINMGRCFQFVSRAQTEICHKHTYNVVYKLCLRFSVRKWEWQKLACKLFQLWKKLQQSFSGILKFAVNSIIDIIGAEMAEKTLHRKFNLQIRYIGFYSPIWYSQTIFNQIKRWFHKWFHEYQNGFIWGFYIQRQILQSVGNTEISKFNSEFNLERNSFTETFKVVNLQPIVKIFSLRFQTNKNS